MVGLAHLVVGSGVVGSSAFAGSSTTPSADLRILAEPNPFLGLELRPGRDDEAYVETDEEGLVTGIVLTEPGDAGVSKGAITRFVDIVEIHKLPPGPPIDELSIEFEVIDEGLVPPDDPTPAEIEEALFIAAADVDVPGDGSTNYLRATDVAGAHDDLLSPNQHVPFGIGVDLVSPGITDLPDPTRFGIGLRITAEHVPQGNGPPGAGGGNRG